MARPYQAGDLALDALTGVVDLWFTFNITKFFVNRVRGVKDDDNKNDPPKMPPGGSLFD